jgi:hypothetical protein
VQKHRGEKTVPGGMSHLVEVWCIREIGRDDFKELKYYYFKEFK